MRKSAVMPGRTDTVGREEGINRVDQPPPLDITEC